MNEEERRELYRELGSMRSPAMTAARQKNARKAREARKRVWDQAPACGCDYKPNTRGRTHRPDCPRRIWLNQYKRGSHSGPEAAPQARSVKPTDLK